MLSSMCEAIWKEHTATLRYVEGLKGTPQILSPSAELRPTARPASRKVVKSIAQDLHDNGVWPILLH
jgi:hypothetical protein